MVFACPTIHTQNLSETSKFYKEFIGMEEVKRFSPRDEVTILFLKDKDGGIIEIVEDLKKNLNPESNVSLLFGINNLDKTLEELKKHQISIVAGSVEIPSGEKFVFIKDPNGIEIELMEGLNI